MNGHIRRLPGLASRTRASAHGFTGVKPGLAARSPGLNAGFLSRGTQARPACFQRLLRPGAQPSTASSRSRKVSTVLATSASL